MVRGSEMFWLDRNCSQKGSQKHQPQLHAFGCCSFVRWQQGLAGSNGLKRPSLQTWRNNAPSGHVLAGGVLFFFFTTTSFSFGQKF